MSNKSVLTIESISKTTIIGLNDKEEAVTISGSAVEAVATKFTVGSKVEVTFGADGKAIEVTGVKTAASASRTGASGGRSAAPVMATRMPR